MIYSNHIPDMPSEDSDDSPRNKKANLKTIWSKFSVQMKNLMYELAEPLLDLGASDKKKKSDCEV
jgi:hypothetical protein